MSLTKNNCVRCDWCGRLSRAELGEYLRPDGVTAGYIHAPDWDKEGELDICCECADGRCPGCGGDSVVRITPGIAGPVGWGARCKTCGHQWKLVGINETINEMADEFMKVAEKQSSAHAERAQPEEGE